MAGEGDEEQDTNMLSFKLSLLCSWVLSPGSSEIYLTQLRIAIFKATLV